MTFITLICIIIAVVLVIIRLIIWIIHRKRLNAMRGFKGIGEIEQDVYNR